MTYGTCETAHPNSSGLWLIQAPTKSPPLEPPQMVILSLNRQEDVKSFNLQWYYYRNGFTIKTAWQAFSFAAPIIKVQRISGKEARDTCKAGTQKSQKCKRCAWKNCVPNFRTCLKAGRVTLVIGRVILARGLKIPLVYEQNFPSGVPLSNGSTLQAWLTCFVMRHHVRIKYTFFVTPKN